MRPRGPQQLAVRLAVWKVHEMRRVRETVDMSIPPLHATVTTLTCHFGATTDHACDAPAVWHLSWYDPTKGVFTWPNSLACQRHRDLATEMDWDIGWRHRVLPVCTLPGSQLVIADQGEDEDGMPVSFCIHPLDAQFAVEAERQLEAVW